MQASTSPVHSPPKSRVPDKKHVCNICQKAFDRKDKQKQHRRDTHPAGSADRTNNARDLQRATASTTTLSHLGITYTTLSNSQTAMVCAQLPSLCHSEQRLLKEGYTIADDDSVDDDIGADLAQLSLGAPNPAVKMTSIVIDCEMAGIAQGKSELVHMTLVDFLSGHVLLSRPVRPTQPITDWRTAITGINALTMQAAIDNKTALNGFKAARAELLRLADHNTILIGQSLYNDLKVLHTSHTRVVDTAVLASDAVLGKHNKIRKRWGLQELCRELLHIMIRQPPSPNSSPVHDAVEDALATRELVLSFILEPETLSNWAKKEKRVFHKKKTPRKKKQPSRSRPGEREAYYQSTDINLEYDTDTEVLRWEDVVDWDAWPKSPPDSD